MAEQGQDNDAVAPAWMTEAELGADIERITQHRHRLFAVFQVTGGWVIRCLNCKIEGKRKYQAKELAIRIADDLRVIDKPECSHTPSP